MVPRRRLLNPTEREMMALIAEVSALVGRGVAGNGDPPAVVYDGGFAEFNIGAIANIGIAVFTTFRADALMSGDGPMAAQYARAVERWTAADQGANSFIQRAVPFLQYIRRVIDETEWSPRDKFEDILMMTKYFWDKTGLPRPTVVETVEQSWTGFAPYDLSLIHI